MIQKFKWERATFEKKKKHPNKSRNVIFKFNAMELLIKVSNHKAKTYATIHIEGKRRIHPSQHCRLIPHGRHSKC